MNSFFSLIDCAIAADFGVPVNEYIEKIESVDEDTMTTILMLYFGDNVKEAKELFDGI